jgi:hypothetical protein
MGSNFSYEASSPKAEHLHDETNSSSTVPQKTVDLNHVEYVYLVNYNDDFYFTVNSEEIIDIITSLKQQYVKLALNNWNIYNYQIYEKVYNKYQKTNLEDNNIEEILKPKNMPESNKQMQEVYSLDICKSIKNIIIHVESNLEKLRVYRLYNLSNIFEIESDSEEEDTKYTQDSKECSNEADSDTDKECNNESDKECSNNSNDESNNEYNNTNNEDTESESEVILENNDIILETKKNL